MRGAILALILALLHVFVFSGLTWASASPKGSDHPKRTVKKTTSAKRIVKAGNGRKTATAKKTRRAHSSLAVRKRIVTRHARAARQSLRSKSRIVARRARSTPVLTRPSLSAADSGVLGLKSGSALVLDATTSEVLFSKNPDSVLPIASLTKLMTALVVLDAKLDMTEVLTVTADDLDRYKGTSSRLRIGSRLSRADMLHIALMSSENRAASALGRHYPGGLSSFVAAMNTKARALGMIDTRYVEPTGLSSQNVSSARDLAKLVSAANEYPLVRQYSTSEAYQVDPGGRPLQYRTSNRLVVSNGWDIDLQKTGYISEAGRCLVMRTVIAGRPVVMVFLDAHGKFSRAADAARVRSWLEAARSRLM